MYNYLKSFPVMGYIKLSFGVFFIITGIIDKQTSIAVMGGILLLLTLINKGACPGGSCAVPPRNRK